MRAAHHPFLAALLWLPAIAPAQTPVDAAARAEPRSERIHLEDAGSRVDELRVGGRTQRIAVQTKIGGLPGYEVLSPDGARGQSSGAESGAGGRVWTLFKF